MDRISSDFRAALRRHIMPAQSVERGLRVAEARDGTMTPPLPAQRSAWAGIFSSGWLFVWGGLLAAAFAVWLVITLLGCSEGCCGGVAW